MKNSFILIISATISCALFKVQAQGTLYLSNLSESRPGYYDINSESWVAQGFETGVDSAGYVLDSALVGITGAGQLANLNGLNVSIYSALNGSPYLDLGALSGPGNPASSGPYSFTASGITLSPSTQYFIVATATTPPAQNIYSWIFNVADLPYTSVDQWAIGPNEDSANGATWSGAPGYGFEMEIYATAVPEPSTWVLCLLGGGFAFYFHKRKQRLTEM
jgi:hypothetical protein